MPKPMIMDTTQKIKRPRRVARVIFKKFFIIVYFIKSVNFASDAKSYKFTTKT